MKRTPEPNASIESKAPPRANLARPRLAQFSPRDVQTAWGRSRNLSRGYKWNEESVGLALTWAGSRESDTNTRRRLVDYCAPACIGRHRRTALAAVAAHCLFPRSASHGRAVLIGTSSVFGPAICAMSLGIVGRAAFDTRRAQPDIQLGGKRDCRGIDGPARLLRSNRSIFFFVAAFASDNSRAPLIRPAELTTNWPRRAGRRKRAKRKGLAALPRPHLSSSLYAR